MNVKAAEATSAPVTLFLRCSDINSKSIINKGRGETEGCVHLRWRDVWRGNRRRKTLGRPAGLRELQEVY